METTQSILNLPLPPLDDAVADAVERYQSRLLNPEQVATGLPAIRHLVLACDPVSPTDAQTMLATASRFFSDVALAEGLDVGELLTDLQVSQWLFAKRREGMPTQTLSNHRQRLARFLRVKRGLPARMTVRGIERRQHAPLGDDARLGLEESLTVANVQLSVAYVAAIGAGVIGSAGVGTAVEVDGEAVWLVRGEERWPVASELSALAAGVEGVVLAEGAWGRLRKHAEVNGARLDKTSARATFTVLALSGDASPASLISRFGLTRRALDDACKCLSPIDPGHAAVLLRG